MQVGAFGVQDANFLDVFRRNDTDAGYQAVYISLKAAVEPRISQYYRATATRAHVRASTGISYRCRSRSHSQ